MELLTLSNATMSSREIATLCEKRYPDVKRDIDVMATQLDLDTRKFAHIYLDNMNRQQIEYRLNKDLTITLVAGYNTKLRYRIIQRWQELEAAQPSIPQTLPDALRLAADLAEQNARAGERLAIAEPKAAAYDAITHAPDNLCIRDTAKTLNLHQNHFVEWCLNNQWLYRDQKNTLKAYAKRIDQEYLHQKINLYATKTGEDRISVQVKFTPKGVSRLAKIFGVAL